MLELVTLPHQLSIGLFLNGFKLPLRLQDRIEVCLAEIAFARHVETISLESVVFSRVK